MKRIACLLLACMLLFGLCACGDDTEETAEETTQTQSQTGNTGTTSDTTKPKTQTQTIDYDLTKMNSTMVYSTVYDMVQGDSDKYEGKVVKMRGEFTVGYSRSTKLYYPAVIISDATACCSQGLEFVLKNDPAYPDGYPAKGEEVTVVGTFRIYYEGKSQFVHLVNSVIV